MKRLTILFCLALLTLTAGAQPKRIPPECMGGEDIIRMQTRDIVSWLDLDKGTEARFVKEYSAFRKEIDGIAKSARPPHDIMDESEMDKAIQRNFEVSEQILQTRKKYYARFKEFLKPSQIQMIYHLENEAGRRIHGGHEGPYPGERDCPGDRPMPPGNSGEGPVF